MALEGMILETNEPPDLEGAIVAYANAAKADGGDWGSLNNLAHILMRLPTGEPKENLAAAAEALEGSKKRAPHRLEPVLNLALVYARLEQHEQALAAAKEVIERAGKAQAELKQQAEKLVATLQKK
jgi:anthranilate phosphoribosyltransferase